MNHCDSHEDVVKNTALIPQLVDQNKELFKKIDTIAVLALDVRELRIEVGILKDDKEKTRDTKLRLLPVFLTGAIFAFGLAGIAFGLWHNSQHVNAQEVIANHGK